MRTKSYSPSSPFAGSDLKSLGLSGQEEQVIRLSTTGLGDKEIAVAMGISVDTVRTYWQRIRRKAGGSTRSEIVASMVRRGVDVQIDLLDQQNEALAKEIHLRKATEEELLKSEQLFRAMSESCPLGVYVCNSNGEVTYVNERYTQISGLTREQCLGHGWTEVLHPADRDGKAAAFANAIDAGTDFIHEHRIIRPNGEIVHVRSRAKVLQGKSGSLGYVGSMEDVTDTLVTQLQLAATEKMLTRMNMTLPDLVYVYDLVSHKNVYCNRNVAEILGYSDEEILALGDQLFATLMHPGDLPHVLAKQAEIRYMSDGAVMETEYRMKRKDGCWCWLSSRDVVFERDENGLGSQMLGIASDITKAKRDYENLRDYSAILESELDGIAILDAEGHYVSCNRAFAKLVQTDVSAVIGKHWSEIFPKDHLPEYCELEADVKRLRKVERDFERTNRDGSLLAIRVLLVAISSEDGSFPGYYCLKRDITDQVLLQREVQELRDKVSLQSGLSVNQAQNLF